MRTRSLSSAIARAAAWLGYLFLILPSLIVVPMSFGDKDDLQFPPHGFSLYLYRRFFFESGWMSATAESFEVAICAAVVALVFGAGAAYGLNRFRFPGRQFVRLVLLSPLFVPAVVIALGFYLYFGALGLAGTTAGLVLGHAVLTIPFVLVSTSAGLQHVDRRLETAAMVMGASRIAILWRVTLPLLRPALVAGGLFAFLISFDEVAIAYFISDNTTETLPVKMYSSIQWETSPVLAVVSTLMTAMSLGACLAIAFLQRTEKAK